MRSQVLRVNIPLICRAGELSDGDMVGVTIISIWWKRDDDLGLNVTDVRDDLANRFFVIRLIYFAIDLVEEAESAHAKFFDRILQFPGAAFAESLQAGILFLGTDQPLCPREAQT